MGGFDDQERLLAGRFLVCCEPMHKLPLGSLMEGATAFVCNGYEEPDDMEFCIYERGWVLKYIVHITTWVDSQPGCQFPVLRIDYGFSHQIVHDIRFI